MANLLRQETKEYNNCILVNITSPPIQRVEMQMMCRQKQFAKMYINYFINVKDGIRVKPTAGHTFGQVVLLSFGGV